MFKAGLLAAFAVQLVVAQNDASSNLPVVDLGYEQHRALAFNDTGKYYNFSNIRFAAPVTGENRWTVPKPPAVNRSSIQTGAQNVICPQALPGWSTNIAATFAIDYLGGKTSFNASDFKETNTTLPKDGPGVTEDCLFLDVMVPEQIFKAAGKGYGAPVLVWIYGGGYTAGSKAGSGDPAGLIARSQDDGQKGVIYVAMNYRLGAFGWQSGPTYQENGTANLGLYDQRFALEWVQNNIHLFGGDPNRVTVFGESAGGGSIMHQITAYGGLQGRAPFQQALPQSPGWVPVVSSVVQEQAYQEYLSLLNVSTLEEARQLPYEALQTANLKQVGAAPYGGFVYGPAVDGHFVPALPGQLLARGQFDQTLNIMVGHNADEGLIFTSPFINSTETLLNQLETTIPSLKAFPDMADYIVNTLYPAPVNGTSVLGYTNEIARGALVISEAIFTCNTFYLDKAYENRTHSYLFSVPPAFHGFDIPYTYYNGASGLNTTIAYALQDYITSFASNGNPNEEGVPFFNMYGQNATVQNLNVTGIRGIMDPAANQRCNFWQKALYY